MPKPGHYRYTLDAQAVFMTEEGEQVPFTGAGQGSIDVEKGEAYDIQGSSSGNTWLATLVKRDS